MFFLPQKEFVNTQTPNHQRAQFSHDCLSCHSSNSWQPVIFQHSKTNFPLDGAHKNVDCVNCHKNEKFSGLKQDCISCHQKDFIGVKTPNHSLGKFSSNCLECHTINSWQPSTFEHSKTEYPLLGAHKIVDCASCHVNGKFKGTAQDCYTCHTKDFNNTTIIPNHITSQFSRDCLECHTLNSWKPSTFDHSKTNYPLFGAHKIVDCASCHVSGKFKGTAQDCYTCHTKDFNNTTIIPNHITSQFSRDCLECHTLNSWKPSTFDHSKTNYPLLGAHKIVDCASCHVNGKFKGTAQDCYTCHTKDFNNTTIIPNHVTSQFSRECLECHTLNSWKPSTFDHSKTEYPLLGAHKSVDCASCHVNGKFKGTAQDCYTCHTKNFTQTINPNHLVAQFSHNCIECHTLNSWKPSTFDHSKTSFKLSGAHQTVDCLFCHKNGQFSGTPTTCYPCHQTQFLQAINPNHQSGGFSQQCETCHSTTSWRPASFEHGRTNFPFRITLLHDFQLNVWFATQQMDGSLRHLTTLRFSQLEVEANIDRGDGHIVAIVIQTQQV